MCRSRKATNMGCGTGMMKAVLIILNIIVLLLGLALTALGAFGLAGEKIIKDGIKLVVDNIPGIADKFGLTSEGNAEDAAQGIIEFLQEAAVPILIVGLVIAIIAICGMCGACCNNKCMLVIYITVLVLILLVQVILVALYASGTLNGVMKKYLKVSIEDNYVSVDSSKPISLAWTVLMLKFECCGANNFTDFDDAQKWERNKEVVIANVSYAFQLAAPIACCKYTGEFPNVEPVLPKTCAISPLSTTASNFQVGCFDKVKDDLKKYSTIIIGIVAGIIAVQFILILFTGLIIHYIGKESKIV